jgi:hypothetical protein
MRSARWLREPVVHFMILGALLFAVYAWLQDDSAPPPDTIVVDDDRIADLTARFRRTWQRPPSDEELGGLIDSWVREEILYREGLALGLDRDDPIVRRRVAQKMRYLADDLADQTPDDAELQAWFEAHPEDYRIEARYTLRQVYFDPLRHGDAIDAVIDAARARLTTGGEIDVGDATLLPTALADASSGEVARTFGADFAAALDDLPVSEWIGPVRSGYGLHLVRIDAREPARHPSLDEVRAAVERDLLSARREDANDAVFEALRKNYVVQIEPGPGAAGGAR